MHSEERHTNHDSTVAIDGAIPSRIEEPTRPEDVAALLAEANTLDLAVAPFGGATKLALGNVIERIDIGLSTAHLRGVIDYEPTDLTLSVAAGSRFADVQAVLAEHGQTLPVEVPHSDRATIGGMIATAIAGPRRFGAGSLRDLLIGISAAHPSGTVTKAGGMVVKNVTGFDLMRLYLGSLGTLGVIVSANFKVLPLPRDEATLLSSFSSWEAALSAATSLRTSRVSPVSLEMARVDRDEWVLAARVEGREATVRLLTAEARELVGGDSRTLASEESATWWRSYVEDQSLTCGPGEALIRCSTNPGSIASKLTRLLDREDDPFRLTQLMVSPGLGSLIVRVKATEGAAYGSFKRLQDALLDHWDHVVVLAADPRFKRELDVWGRTPETIEVMRAIKQEFDPRRVLNPGRFAGFL